MRRIFSSLFAGALMLASAHAASLTPITGPQDPSQLNATINSVISQINSGITPQSMASPGTPRNFLGNGSMLIAQRGTGIQTGATTSAAIAANYAADRWLVDTNVTSGAGRGQVTTATPTPPTGLTNSMRLYRTSGALTQAVCAWQAIPTTDSTMLANQQVTFSVQIQALAGLNADNSNAANLYVIYGTGTNEGFASWTASPAVTPAWTGINSSITKALTVTTSWATYSVSGVIPSTATEVAVGVCFTPTATGAGTTDGLAFTAAQLEIGSSASSFEFRPYVEELLRAYRFYYEIDESATISVLANCRAHSTTVQECYVPFPVTMFKAPTLTYTAGFATETTAAGGTLGACSAVATATTVTSTAPLTNGVLIGCTATTVPAAGVAGFLFNNGGAGKIIASADF